MDSVHVCGQKVASLTDGGRVAAVWWHEGAGGIGRGRGGQSPPLDSPQDFGRFRAKHVPTNDLVILLSQTQCVEMKLRWRFYVHASNCPEVY